MSANPISVVIYSLTFHTVWDLPSSQYDEWCLVETWTFSYYVVRLWILFTTSVLVSFLWHYSIRVEGSLSHYYQMKVEVQFHSASVDTWVGKISCYCHEGGGVLAPHVVSTATTVEVALLLLGSGESPHSLLVSSESPRWGEKEVLITARWGWKPRLPTISNDIAKAWGRPCYQTVGMKVLAPYLAFSDTTMAWCWDVLL